MEFGNLKWKSAKFTPRSKKISFIDWKSSKDLKLKNEQFSYQCENKKNMDEKPFTWFSMIHRVSFECLCIALWDNARWKKEETFLLSIKATRYVMTQWV